MEKIGIKLRELRLAKGLTLSQLADELGYASHGYISEIESGRKIPTAVFVFKVAHFFDVTTDELLNDQLHLNLASNSSANISLANSDTPFIKRPPTAKEIERLRLILSTYQDGTGMLRKKDGTTLPGWRDFERALALAMGAIAPETKWLYDVLLPDLSRPNWFYGVSCKMKEDLGRGRKDQIYIELTNADSAIWQALNQAGLTKSTFQEHPAETGQIILNLITSWHIDANEFQGRLIDTERSIYLALQYNRQTSQYQLFQYPIHLPSANTLHWDATKRSIRGYKDDDVIIEYYGYSGSQVKYYPRIQDAQWRSPVFHLEPLPTHLSDSLLDKTATYFPEQWAQATES